MAARLEKEKVREYAAPAVDRMLDIVEYLSEHSGFYGVSELSRELEISTNSVFRIMKRLVDRGYAEMDPESGGYQLGVKFFSLGMSLSSRFELRRRVRKHLEWLCDKTGETCQIHTPDGKSMLVLDVANAPVGFFLQVIPGTKVNYHCNAFGKAVLAFMEKEELDAALPKRLESLTEKSIVSREALEREFPEIRKTGLAYDREEYNIGIYCIGAPVFNAENKAVAGIGMTGLAGRVNGLIKAKWETMVLKAAQATAHGIGYQGTQYEKWLSARQLSK